MAAAGRWQMQRAVTAGFPRTCTRWGPTAQLGGGGHPPGKREQRLLAGLVQPAAQLGEELVVGDADGADIAGGLKHGQAHLRSHAGTVT